MTHLRVAVIGAGFGGIGTAIRLRQRGYRDFAVFDQADDVGGTWRENTYPGCACDVPSHLYSLSFALNPQWTRSFSGQAEIWEYLRRCVVDFGLAPYLRLGHEVRSANWDTDRWVLNTSRGEFTADVLVAAGGPFSEPAVPALPGLDSFAGEVFHSARWNHDLDLTGRRVAVIGTGASAIQFVPEIAPKVASLTLFQRTPPWVMPRIDRTLTSVERRIYRSVPGAQRLARTAIYWGREATGILFLRPALMRIGQAIARSHLRTSVKDPVLRAKLTPSYTMGCKRVLLSNDYYPALSRDNVTVVTENITSVEPKAVVTADGRAHDVDTIIMGTGFRVTDVPMARMVYGRDGRTLAQAWGDTMTAYLGTSVAGFPNLFLLLGPNTGLGHNSVVFMIEAQIKQVLGALRHLERTGVTAVEPRRAVQERFVARVDERMRNTVWLRGGCRSWYLDSTGRNSTLWPGYSWSYRMRTRRFDPSAWEAT